MVCSQIRLCSIQVNQEKRQALHHHCHQQDMVQRSQGRGAVLHCHFRRRIPPESPLLQWGPSWYQCHQSHCWDDEIIQWILCNIRVHQYDWGVSYQIQACQTLPISNGTLVVIYTKVVISSDDSPAPQKSGKTSTRTIRLGTSGRTSNPRHTPIMPCLSKQLVMATVLVAPISPTKFIHRPSLILPPPKLHSYLNCTTLWTVFPVPPSTINQCSNSLFPTTPNSLTETPPSPPRTKNALTKSRIYISRPNPPTRRGVKAAEEDLKRVYTVPPMNKRSPRVTIERRTTAEAQPTMKPPTVLTPWTAPPQQRLG